MPRKIQYEGKTYEFSDDFTDQDIQAVLSGKSTAPRAPAATATSAPAPIDPRAIIGEGALDFLKGSVVGMVPTSGADLVTLALGPPGSYLAKKMVFDPAAAMAKRASAAPTLSEKVGYGTAAAIPVLGPMAADVGEELGKGKEGMLRLLGKGGAMAALSAGGGALAGRLNKSATSATFNAYSDFEKGRSAATKILAGDDASFHPTIDKALPTVIAEAGGLEKLLGPAPKGLVRRVADASTGAAARMFEYVRTNFINRIGGEEISIPENVRQRLSYLDTESLRMSGIGEEVAPLIGKAVKQGWLTAEESSILKSRMNQIGEKAYVAPAGAKAPPGSEAAAGVAKYLQGQLASRFERLGLRDDYLSADRLQGKIADFRDKAINAADVADNQIPTKPGLGAYMEAQALMGNPAAYNVLAQRFFKSATHPDLIMHKALRQMGTKPLGIPEIEDFVAANLRPADKSITTPFRIKRQH